MNSSRPDGAGMTVGGLTLRRERQRTVKASERVAQEIVREIVRNGLHSGDHLPLEPAMAQQYGVSRTSLREALRLLETQGLLSLKPGPGGGPVVGSVEPVHLAHTLSLYFHLGSTTYDDLMQTQVELESVCARLAASHENRVDGMAPFVVAHGCGDENEFMGATLDFHSAVYRLAGNRAISLLTQAITHTVTRHVLLPVELVERRPAILDEHIGIAKLITAGDSVGAASMTEDHFLALHDNLRQRLPGRGADFVEWR